MEWQNGPAGTIAEGEVAARARIIADYIASMTDRYAILEHQRLFELGPILR
jgi:dGTPase